MATVLRIKLVRSPIGYPGRQKRTVQALGLRKLNQTVERPDTASVRGMVQSIIHLVEVDEVEV
jgi:large subunit ribosomal protein L30